MHNSDQVTFQLLYLQEQKSLTLLSHSFLGGGSDIVSSCFAYKGGQYINYGLMSLHIPWIVQDKRPKLVDDRLTLIVRMGQ